MIWIALALASCGGGTTLPSTAAQATPTASSQPSESSPTESSVSPDINTRYFRPDALERFTTVFEAESREVVEHRDAIVEAMGLEPGMAVADIGAGTGLFTNEIAKRVGSKGKVYAVDIVPAFLERVQRRASDAKLDNIETVLGEEKATTLPTASVDLAFMCDTYHHIEYPKTYMKSLFDALRPGGALVLIDFERIEGVSRKGILYHVRANKETVIDEVTSVGFELDGQVDLLEENYYLRFVRPPTE